MRTGPANSKNYNKKVFRRGRHTAEGVDSDDSENDTTDFQESDDELEHQSQYDDIENINLIEELMLDGDAELFLNESSNVDPNKTYYTINKQTILLGHSAEAAVNLMNTLVGLYADFVDSSLLKDLDADQVEAKIRLCTKRFAKSELEESARIGAELVEIPVELLNATKVDLIRLGSLANLSREYQRRGKSVGFNKTRAETRFSGCPISHRERCFDIALNGVEFSISDGFRAQETPPPMRWLGKSLGKYYLQCTLKSVKEGTGFILYEEDLTNICKEQLNYVHAHCVFQDKPRFIMDCSNSLDNAEPFNGPHSKEWAKTHYGELVLPTIEEFLSSILTYCEEQGIHPRQMRFIFLDVSNAFGKMPINPEYVRYCLVKVHSNPDIIHGRITAFFGKSEFPYQYNPISKCFDHKGKEIVHGALETYVDDTAACVLADHAIQDLADLKRLHEEVLGEKGLNVEKSSRLPSLTGEWIGWFMDLDTVTVRPSDKAIDKLMFVFYVVIDVEAAHWELHHVQAVVSLSIHYSKALRGMRCFTQPFVKMLRGVDRKSHAKRTVTEDARFAVHVWRAAILQPSFLAIPMSAMLTSNDEVFDYMTINDAANALGIAIFDENKNLIIHSDYELPFTRTHSRFQNVKEFLGFILNLLMIAKIKRAPRGTKILMLTDSFTAKTMIEKNRNNSVYANVAFFIYTWVLLHRIYHHRS